MSVGWGGLIAGIGLVVANDRPGWIKLAVSACLCLLAGFLAGVRAEDRRVLHAGLAAVAGFGFHAIYAVATRIADRLGGPDAADWIPAGSGWRWRLPVLLAVSLLGGAIAAYRLRPGDQRRRRS